jgi:hypothetical protein
VQKFMTRAAEHGEVFGRVVRLLEIFMMQIKGVVGTSAAALADAVGACPDALSVSSTPARRIWLRVVLILKVWIQDAAHRFRNLYQPFAVFGGAKAALPCGFSHFIRPSGSYLFTHLRPLTTTQRWLRLALTPGRHHGPVFWCSFVWHGVSLFGYGDAYRASASLERRGQMSRSLVALYAYKGRVQHIPRVRRRAVTLLNDGIEPLAGFCPVEVLLSVVKDVLGSHRNAASGLVVDRLLADGPAGRSVIKHREIEPCV